MSTVPPAFLSLDYNLLARVYAALQSTRRKQDEALLRDLEQRLQSLAPTAPVLEPHVMKLFTCGFCDGPLRIVRVTRICEAIPIDNRTGTAGGASELLEGAGEPAVVILDARVTCAWCLRESTRVQYHWPVEGLAITCCVCGGDYFLEKGEAVYEDAQGHPRPVCSPACRESFLCEP